MGGAAKIGLLGLGHVGTSVLEILHRSAGALEDRLGTKLVVTRVLVRDPSKPRTALAEGIVTVRPQDILLDDEISVVVEAMGGEEPALSYMRQALSHGKSVVTANKEVVSKHGRELMEMARKNGVRFLYEASVGGGIPLIRPLKECLIANEMSMLMGILNGTTNYILTSMEDRGLESSDALREAQRLGYAESDPSSDLSGADAARKIAVLSSIAFNTEIVPGDVKTVGIGDVGLLDVRYAKELGCTVKLTAYCIRRQDRVEICVCPMLLRDDHPLAPVSGVFNAVMAEGDAVGRVMFYGQGAGGMPTASAVVGDIADVVRNRSLGGEALGYRGNVEILAPGEIRSRFYLRLKVADRPGVLSRISGVLGDRDISLSIVLQKTSLNGIAEIVMVTHEARSGDMEDAVLELKTCEEVAEVPCLMRVWG